MVPTSRLLPYGTWAVVPTRGLLGAPPQSPPPPFLPFPHLLPPPPLLIRAGDGLRLGGVSCWGRGRVLDEGQKEAQCSEWLSDFDCHFFLFSVALLSLAFWGTGLDVQRGGVIFVPPSPSSSPFLCSAPGPPISRQILPSSHSN